MNVDNFDDIRPYLDSEVPDAVFRLVRDKELTELLAGWLMPRLIRMFPQHLPKTLSWYLQHRFRGVRDIAGFQSVVASYARKLVREGTTEFRYEGFDDLDPDSACLFVSNHRDIAGDSMLLNYALYLMGHDTVRIAIGDNLVQREFATSLMRLNKGFFIKRSVGGPRKTYAALLQSSKYVKHSLEEGQSVWIAQREGRSKDGLDLTDPAIIKMFLLADRKQPLNLALERLRIVPLAISYEWDPCDVLKAKELATIKHEGSYKKPPGEDLLAMVQGLSGMKGRVILRLGDQLRGDRHDYQSVADIATEIDRQILSRLELFPINHWALSQIDEPEYQCLAESLDIRFDSDEVAGIQARLAACPPAYRQQWLKMYANPVMNRHRAGIPGVVAAAPIVGT